MRSERINKILIFISLFIFLLISAFSSVAFFQRSAEKGAWIYSAFDKVLGIETISIHNPLWDSSLSNEVSAAESWRCSTCHGWNYQGMVTFSGVLVDYPGLQDVSEMTDDEISSWLNGEENRDHDFSKYLTIESGEELLSFFRNDRFEKWVNVDEVEIIKSGNSSLGEEIYKDICIECHGSLGAKINLGSLSQPLFIGDLVAAEQSRIVHHLEFGFLSHKKIFELDPNVNDTDLINITKYLTAMPISSTIMENREILQLRAFEDQGDLQFLLIAAFTLFLILLGAYFIVSTIESKRSGNK